MKNNKIQVILPDAIIDKFEKEAKKQNRSRSNLARMFIIEGLSKTNDTDVKFINARNHE